MSDKPVHVNQIDLIVAIQKHLSGRHKGLMVNQRQLNATIEAANLIVAAFERPHTPASAGMGLTAWLRCDETGDASLTMARLLAPCIGQRAPTSRPLSVPKEPDSFRRCVGLLRAEPALRQHLPAMAKAGPDWAILVGHWEELESLVDDEQRLSARLTALQTGEGHGRP